MTPKEEAKRIFDEYDRIEVEAPFYIMSRNQAKQCALICVDETSGYLIDMIGIDWNIRKIFIQELEEVKKEIEKL